MKGLGSDNGEGYNQGDEVLYILRYPRVLSVYLVL